MSTPVEQPPFLSPPLHVKSLLWFYGMIALYSFVATVTTVPTLFISFGQLWGTVGPLAMLLISITVLVGLYRSLAKGKRGTEIVSTLLLIGLLVGYSVAILIRAMIFGRWDQSAGTVLPLIICVPAYFRILEIFPPLPARLWNLLPARIRRR